MKVYKNSKGELHRTDGPAVKLSNGTKEWYLNGKYHRTDGPAIEDADGNKFWYLNGKRHRTDGPAIEFTVEYKAHRTYGAAIGYKAWYLNGKCHRISGPAIEYANGAKEWYLNGERLTEEEFNDLSFPICNGNIIEIRKEVQASEV